MPGVVCSAWMNLDGGRRKRKEQHRHLHCATDRLSIRIPEWAKSGSLYGCDRRFAVVLPYEEKKADEKMDLGSTGGKRCRPVSVMGWALCSKLRRSLDISHMEEKSGIAATTFCMLFRANRGNGSKPHRKPRMDRHLGLQGTPDASQHREILCRDVGPGKLHGSATATPPHVPARSNRSRPSDDATGCMSADCATARVSARSGGWKPSSYELKGPVTAPRCFEKGINFSAPHPTIQQQFRFALFATA